MKVALLMSPKLSDFRKRTLQPVLQDSRFTVALAVIDDRPAQTGWQRLKKNLRRGRGGYVLVMAFRRFFAPACPQEDTEAYCVRHGIAVFRTVHPYGEDALGRVRQCNPDVLILIEGFGIVKKKMIDLAAIGVLSYHHGDMRRYRGMPPGLWELYNGEKEMGITVQLITPGLDNGRPVVEQTIAIEKEDDVESLTARALSVSEPMLLAALLKLADSTFVAPKVGQFGKVYTLPNLRQWLTLQYRIWKKK